MCGVAGIVSVTAAAGAPSREALMRMLGALAHRGPDERGLYRDERAGLAHARLSIIDISSGQQPLADASGTTWIVFNGEIFNYVELREKLIGLGYRFRTRSDTEVIVNAYRAWGEDAFERMTGQWALAIWDSVARRLVLARDRTGICPLHFCEREGRLYFASEVKAIFAADAAIPRTFDPVGIDQTFTLWTVVPPQSVFQGIKELVPGHFRIYENGNIREKAFWKPRYPQLSSSARRPVCRFTRRCSEAGAQRFGIRDVASNGALRRKRRQLFVRRARQFAYCGDGDATLPANAFRLSHCVSLTPNMMRPTSSDWSPVSPVVSTMKWWSRAATSPRFFRRSSTTPSARS